jgi:hypothetical protein
MRVGDYGGVLRITVKEDGAVKDISGFTTAKQLRLIKPDRTTETTVTATFTTDGTDGKLQYTIPSGFLTHKGHYRVQVLLTSGSAYLQSSIGSFPVEGNQV